MMGTIKLNSGVISIKKTSSFDDVSELRKGKSAGLSYELH